MLEVIILAAGEGKRMNSARPKVLQPVGGRPMLGHLLDTVAGLAPERVHVVVGAAAGRVREAFSDRDIRWVEQSERLGTGHAALQAMPGVDERARVLILPGDMPLIESETLQELLAVDADLAVLSFIAPDPTGYGRIVRTEAGVAGICEEQDASAEQKRINEVNSGVLAAPAGKLAGWLQRLGDDNAQGEYYLTDCVALAVADGERVDALAAARGETLLGANDRIQLAALENVFQNRCRRALMAAGATLLDPDSVYVRGSVEAGRDVTVDVNVVFEGDVVLGDGVDIGPGCVIRDCELASGTQIAAHCVLEGVRTTGACSIGPFARLRPGTELAAEVKVGNFVEIKNARLADGAKASHLSYVGDAEIGAGANLGAGTITCNYDGVSKHRTVIGADAFIGSNSSLVAPVEIGKSATIGAGSVISRSAPAGTLTLTRARQRTVEGWKRPGKPEKKP